MSLNSPYASQIGKGAYAAIVYLDGDLCVAEDNVGNVISEQAKSDHVSDVIQAAADKVLQGKIFVNQESENYVIKSGVTLSPKTSFVSDGAKLDLTGLNTLFLTIGSDGVIDYHLGPLEISGFYLLGDTANLNTKFVKATNVPRVLNIHDIQHKYMNNLIEVRGISWGARINNVNGNALKGTWIKFSSFDANSIHWLPNASNVSHCELSNVVADTSSSKGIEILASPTVQPDGISISNVWIERLQTPIYNEGFATRINNCPFLQTNDQTGFVIKNIKSGSITNSGKHLLVSGCNIAPTANGIGIYSQGADGIFENNHLHGINTTRELIKLDAEWLRNSICGNSILGDSNATYAAINSVSDGYLEICNNLFNCTRPAITGKVPYSLIGNNRFSGNDTYTTLNDLDAESCQIVSNFFYGGLYWLNSSLLTDALVQNNRIHSIVNVAPTVGSGCIVKHNYGYVTEKDGTSTGTGSQQTVAHGLDGTPTIVMVGDIEQNSAPYQSASADGTNIYVTAGNGLDWWWKAEV